MIEVKIGQVWADKDPRINSRLLRVSELEPGHAYLTPVVRLPLIAGGGYAPLPGRGTRIQLRRFSRFLLVDDFDK